MPDDVGAKLGRWLRVVRDKAAETVARESAALVRGQVVGKTVLDDDGTVIAESGQRVDNDMIARAERAGRISALVAAVLAAQAQDVRERVHDLRSRTDDGREADSVASVDDAMEARRYIGRVAVVDVTTVRGEIIVAGGTRIREEHIGAAREAGQLSALIFSVSQTQPTPEVAAGREPTDGPARDPASRPSGPLPPTLPDFGQEDETSDP